MTIRRSHKISPVDSRLRLGVFKFASCDGCQLSVLNLEDDFLALGSAMDIAYFPEASSGMKPGPYDIALVEGSITTPEDAVRILAVREQTNDVDHDRRLRHGRRDSSLTQLGRCRSVQAGGLSQPAIYSEPQHLDTDLRPCARRFRTLGLSDRQRPVVARHHGPCCRGATAAACRQRLPRMQATRQRLRNGCSRHTLSGTGHEDRLRRDLSQHGTGLLRLLRPSRRTNSHPGPPSEHPVVGPTVSRRAWPDPDRGAASIQRNHRRDGIVQAGK